MRNLFISLFLIVILVGCKTTPINQKVNKKRIGFWIEECKIDSTSYKSAGKYKNGDPIKKWCYYTNNVIYKKEIYRNNKCITTNYYPNGTIQSKGKTSLIMEDSNAHWFYYGNWKYYDENGKLTSIKKYENGKFISETKLQLLTKEKIKTIKK